MGNVHGRGAGIPRVDRSLKTSCKLSLKLRTLAYQQQNEAVGRVLIGFRRSPN